jgi:type I restriction-modification system DNA methylase subunit
MNKIQAKENLAKLIAKFEKEKAAGLVQEYNEEATKMAFINPLLKDVLGWDVNNRNEVSPEEKVSRERVDYGIKIDNKTKYFVEAKPIKADLDKHIEQAVRYGYNRKDVPLVLLTDFEGIMLFDVTIKPDSRNWRKGLKIDLQYAQYLKEFDKLWVLSKESVIKGEHEKLLVIKPKARLPVDKAILDDLKNWRESLAKDIYKNNPKLFHSGDLEKDANYLKEITQKILDRIIFMRSCEDRNLIHRSHLRRIFEERTDSVGTATMAFIREEFKDYNRVFDSDLFRSQEWEDNLLIDFKVMKGIILDTYNPYQFDVIPLDVLGNIYEQYLGYTIRLTEHQVKYELKPDVRKAGGVYYTPEYIVDYIVKNTVGKQLQELPVTKIKKLRILDPACGSGSFLIRAYEEMLNYYRTEKKRIKKEAEGQEKLNLEHDDKSRRLTIFEKRDILRNHIFGVDIDEQAVEVTKLSLMLKMLEDEFIAIPGNNILPMLDSNIRCGNSLISGDTLELKRYFGEDYYKVKPFNWKDRFKTIMIDEGGFDVVIGNPPYGASLTPSIKKYLSKKYSFVSDFETSQYFIAESERISKQYGKISFIVPNTLFLNIYAEKFRHFIASSFSIAQLANLSEIDVFKGATVRTMIPFLSKGKIKKTNIRFVIFQDEVNLKEVGIVEQNKLIENDKDWVESFNSSTTIQFRNKLLSATVPLGEILEISQGLIPYDKYRGHDEYTVKNRIWHSDKKKNKTYKKELKGGDVKRYSIIWNGKRWISYGSWLAAPRKPEYFTEPRLLFREITDPKLGLLNVAYSEEEYYNNPAIINCISKGTQYSFLYLLGLVNSHLIAYLHFSSSPKARKGVFPKILVNDVRKLPIKQIDFSDDSAKKIHDKLVAIVEVILDLNKKIQGTKGSEIEQIKKQIEKTDIEIDRLVYKLYGLTEEEIKIVENRM